MIPYNNMNLVAVIDVLFHSELIDGKLREFTDFQFGLDFETTSATHDAYTVKFDVMNSSGNVEEKTFSAGKGIFIPIFDEEHKIQALSIHLDKPFNNTKDMWFSSKDKINGTGTKNLLSKNNIDENTNTVVLTDNFLLGNYIKASLNVPMIAFSNISNSYQILKVIESTNVDNIIFAFKIGQNDNLDYIINRVFKDLIPLGYNLETKAITDFKEVLDKDFLTLYSLRKVA